MSLYPNGVYREPYQGFRDDAVLTLGRCMMDGQCWNGPNIVVGTILHPSNNNPNRVWGWWDASGDFAASMFVLEITSPHWRAQVMVWMVGAHDILNGTVKWPSKFPENARPSVYWDWKQSWRRFPPHLRGYTFAGNSLDHLMCLEVLAQIAANAPGRVGEKRLGELLGLVTSSRALILEITAFAAARSTGLSRASAGDTAFASLVPG